MTGSAIQSRQPLRRRLRSRQARAAGRSAERPVRKASFPSTVTYTAPAAAGPDSVSVKILGVDILFSPMALTIFYSSGVEDARSHFWGDRFVCSGG